MPSIPRAPTSLRGLLLPLAVLLLCAAPLRAEEDGPKEDSPAAEAFREAWWQETGAGALDRALAGYRAALAAEGSEAVRARALYRMGLVLQRMGRTDEALRALKRLADEFPAQEALLAQAAERLEAWTAVDLRDQFPEWYRRYQYSPEFQAKIVDLVLKLGVGDRNAQRQAQAELLTIGEPAIPALLQHAGSANRTLARTVTELLLDLGRLPPAERLFAETSWYRDDDFWKGLHAADATTKAAYRQAAAAQEDNWLARWVEATIEGPEAVLAALRTEAASAGSAMHAFLAPWFEEGAATPAFFGALRAMVLDDTVPDATRQTLAGRLLPAFDYDGPDAHPYGLTPEEVVRWARSDQDRVRQAAWHAMRVTHVHSQDALDAVTSYVLSNPASDSDDRNGTSGAIFGILRTRDDLQGTADAVDALVKLLAFGGMSKIDTNALRDRGPQGSGSPAVPMRVFAQAIGQVRGNHARSLATTWNNHREGLPEDERQAQLLAWTTTAADGEVRRGAMMLAARQARGHVHALTAPIIGEDASQGLVQAFFNGLGNGNAQALPWDAESITRMVEAAKRHFASQGTPSMARPWNVAGTQIRIRPPHQGSVPHVFMRMMHEGDSIPTFLDAAVTFPDRFDGDVLLYLGEEWKNTPANRELVLAALRRGWAQWRPDRREAGLDALLRDTTIEKGDPDTDALLRTLLRSEGNTPAVRGQLLEYVSKLSLADVRGAFDLSTNEGVDQAAPLLPRLPRTAEVYDAFKPALRPEGEAYHHVFTWFKSSEDQDLVRDMLSRMLEHGFGNARLEALNHMKTRASAADLGLWVQALGNSYAPGRRLAAERLGMLYDADAIKALARAVDDPDPEVRDAVLASLERIQKTEEQKKRWRAFAETGKLPEDR